MTTQERDSFYHTYAWEQLRDQVLEMDNYECQICKAKGKHSRGKIVHHQFHLDEFPEYAMDVNVEQDGKVKRNLLTVCRSCHENVCHPERLRKNKSVPLTEERW